MPKNTLERARAEGLGKKSNAAVAKEIGVSRERVRQLRAKEGLPLPKRGRPRKDARPDDLMHFGFDMPPAEGQALRDQHAEAFAETGLQLGPWLRRVVRKARKIPVAK